MAPERLPKVRIWGIGTVRAQCAWIIGVALVASAKESQKGPREAAYPFLEYPTSQTEPDVSVQPEFFDRFEPRLADTASLQGRKQWVYL